MCGQRLNNSVILNRLLWQQVDLDLKLSSLSTCALWLSFSTFSSSPFLNTSFHPIEYCVFLYASPFFPTHPFQSPPLILAFFFLLPFFFFSLAAWSLCHPFFLIRLFVPSLPLPGVSSACLPVCEIREQAVGTSC